MAHHLLLKLKISQYNDVQLYNQLLYFSTLFQEEKILLNARASAGHSESS